MSASGQFLVATHTSELDAFYRRLQASGGSGGRPLSPATVRRIHGILRRALGQGVKWGWMGVNPAAWTSPPRVHVPALLTVAETIRHDLPTCQGCGCARPGAQWPEADWRPGSLLELENNLQGDVSVRSIDDPSGERR